MSFNHLCICDKCSEYSACKIELHEPSGEVIQVICENCDRKSGGVFDE